MKAFKSAIYGALAGSSRLVAMLGASAISTAWPATDARYSDVAAGVTDFATLPAISPERARITFRCITPTEDYDLPTRRDSWQIDIWSRSERLNDAICEQVRTILDRNPLTVAGYRVTEQYCTWGPDFFEADTGIRHGVMTLEIFAIASS